MDELGDVGASLPLYVLFPTLLLTAALLIRLLWRTPSAAARFACFAIWMRCALSAWHDFSFSASPIGMSYNALASIAISVAGLFVLRWRKLSDVALLPFYPLLACFIVSGVHSNQISSMNVALSKFTYLIVLILAVKDALDDIGPERLFKLLLWTFALPLILQLQSLALGVAKAGEADGSASYIGGYYHESAFSVALSAAILCICMLKRVSTRAKIALVVYGFVAIVLANYRTAVLSIMPLVGITLVAEITRRFVPRQRPIVLGAMMIVMAAVVMVGAFRESERFADLTTVAKEGTNIIQRPEVMSPADRNVLSGRTFIWSNYYYGWYDAKPTTQLIGFGPAAWLKVFTHYAHNTIISFLYELGVLGVAALLLLWGWMLGLAVRATSGPRAQLVAGHLSFFILNMATMPMWMIEGMIFYGVLCGYTVYWFALSRREGGGGVWDSHSAGSRIGAIA